MQDPPAVQRSSPPPAEEAGSKPVEDEKEEGEIIAERLAKELDRRADELERRSKELEERIKDLVNDEEAICRLAIELERAELLFLRKVSTFQSSSSTLWDYWTDFFFLLLVNLFTALGLFIVFGRSFFVLVVPVITTVLYAPLCYVGRQKRFHRILHKNFEIFVSVFLIQLFISFISITNLVAFTIVPSDEPMTFAGKCVGVLVFLIASTYGAFVLAHFFALMNKHDLCEICDATVSRRRFSAEPIENRIHSPRVPFENVA